MTVRFKFPPSAPAQEAPGEYRQSRSRCPEFGSAFPAARLAAAGRHDTEPFGSRRTGGWTARHPRIESSISASGWLGSSMCSGSSVRGSHNQRLGHGMKRLAHGPCGFLNLGVGVRRAGKQPIQTATGQSRCRVQQRPEERAITGGVAVFARVKSITLASVKNSVIIEPRRLIRCGMPSFRAVSFADCAK